MRLIFVLFLLCATQPLLANTTDDAGCELIGKLAKSTMMMRQSGVSLVEALEVTKPEDTNDRVQVLVSKLARDMAIDAYKRPKYSTEEYQENAITEFSNEWHLSCLEDLLED